MLFLVEFVALDFGMGFKIMLKFYDSMQAIIAEVNHAIGATGVASQECKAVVAQYGETIIKMILAKVQFSMRVIR